MRLKIKKTVLGEEYIFYVYTKTNSLDCIVRQLVKEEEMAAKISPDYKKIILDKPIELKGYGKPLTEGGLAGYGKSDIKKVSTFTIPKSDQKRLKIDFENL